ALCHRGDAEGSDFQRYLLSPCHHRILRRSPFASAEEPGRADRGLALLEVCPYPADSALLRQVRWRACRWRPRLGRPSLCAGPLDGRRTASGRLGFCRSPPSEDPAVLTTVVIPRRRRCSFPPALPQMAPPLPQKRP